MEDVLERVTRESFEVSILVATLLLAIPMPRVRGLPTRGIGGPGCFSKPNDFGGWGASVILRSQLEPRSTQIVQTNGDVSRRAARLKSIVVEGEKRGTPSVDASNRQGLQATVGGRDIVVIGASAGGISALQKIAKGLPPDLPASVFVVVHSSPSSPGMLPGVLARAGSLPVQHARTDQRFERGHIYVAPPDHHLLLDDGKMQLTRGPRENGFRPAVDTLFRSAAEQHGARVVGVVLSGALDDGTRGLQIIKREGGAAVVQRVEEATIPQMPRNAIQNVDVDHVLPAAEIPEMLARLANHGAPSKRTKRRAVSKKSRTMRKGASKLERETPPGSLTPFTCPDCGGTLWENAEGEILSFNCHVGHAFTSESLGANQDERMEQAMWTAFRTLEENAALQRRLAERAHERGLLALAEGHEDRARLASERASMIQAALVREVPPRSRRNTRARTARPRSTAARRR